MLQLIVITLFLTICLNLLVKKFHLPTIIGYILTGTVIAYTFGLHDAVNNHTLKEIAEFGVVFLMFTIGLEFSIEHLKKMRYEVFVAGSLQIAVTTIFVFVVSFFIFDIEQNVSLIIALAIALSSTAIVLKTFNETGEITKRYGQRALGILIMQDIAVIPILLIIGFMANDGAQSFWYVIVETVIGALFLITVLWFIGTKLLEPFLALITKAKSEEMFVATILFLAIGASYFAHALGFSYSLGAFIAGMLISETRYKYQVEADLVPFRDLLLGVFFLTVGMQIKFDIILDYLHIIAVLLVSVMVLKFVIIYALVRYNESQKVSLKTALSLVQIGEFSLALLEMARNSGIIHPPIGQVMIVTIVISMIMTPFILKNLTKISEYFIKDDGIIESDIQSVGYNNHIVILGFGDFGSKVAQKLLDGGENYIALENNIDNYRKGIANNFNLIYANASKKDVLKAINLHLAKYVIIAIDNQHKLYQVCSVVNEMVSQEKIIIKVHKQKELDMIENFGFTKVIIDNELSSQRVLTLLS